MYSKEQLEKYPFFREKLEETDLSGMLDQLKNTDVIGLVVSGREGAHAKDQGQGKQQGNNLFHGEPSLKIKSGSCIFSPLGGGKSGKQKILRTLPKDDYSSWYHLGSPHHCGLRDGLTSILRKITAAFRHRLLAILVSTGSYKGNFTDRRSPRFQHTRGSLDTAMIRLLALIIAFAVL